MGKIMVLTIPFLPPGCNVPRYESSLRIKRIEHRKWKRGCNGLHQLGQPVAPFDLFPVFNPPYPQGALISGKINHHDVYFYRP